MSDEKKTTEAADVATKVMELATASKEHADKATAEVAKLSTEISDVKAALARAEEAQGQKFTEMRQFLENQHGKSGADDYFSMWSKWFCGAHALAKTGRVPDEFKMDGVEYEAINSYTGQKAAITTGTSGTSYLVPTVLMPGMFAAKDIYGSIIPRCFGVTVAPGQTMNFNGENANPSAYWRKSQAAAIPENTQTWKQGNVAPVLAGSFITASNELLEVPGVGFGEKAAMRMVRSIVKLEETSMMQGDDNALGTDYDPPSDGWLTSTSGATDVGSIAADTIAAYIDFIGLCVDQYNVLLDTSEAILILSPAKIMALAAQTVSATNLPGALTWANPVTGVPGQLVGYSYIAHTGAKVSSAHYASLVNLSEVIYANSGKLSVDFNPYSKFLNNATDIRVITHTDWAFPNAANICYGDYS